MKTTLTTVTRLIAPHALALRISRTMLLLLLAAVCLPLVAAAQTFAGDSPRPKAPVNGERKGKRVRAPEAIPGTRMDVDWPRLVSGQDLVLTTPSPDNLRGLRLGNGDIGVALFGPPECLTLAVGKNDILDYRADFNLEGGWNVPRPSVKPAGAIRFRNNSLAGATYSARLHLWDAEVAARLGSTKLSALRTFVSYPRNLVVAEFVPSGYQQFDIELARNRDSTGLIPNPPEFGAAGRDIWVRYKFPADPTNYPQGFEYVMYGRVIGGDDVRSETNINFATIQQWFGQGLWDERARFGQDLEEERQRPTRPSIEGISVAHVKFSKPVIFLVALVTLRDNSDPFAGAKMVVDEAERVGFRQVTGEHRTWWHDYWRRSFVQLSEKSFLTQQWFLSLYHLASCWRAGRSAPGLFGPWIVDDFPAWGNDMHWDYNMQQAIWGAYSSNHLEQTAAYSEQVLALLPVVRQGARDKFGMDDAALYPVVSWPRKYERYPKSPLQISMNGWVAHPMWWYYLYSQDAEYLRKQGYPVIRACARFYEQFVRRASDGKYEMPPTQAWDLPTKKNNGTMDLAFARYLLRACIAASEVLGVDVDRRATWKDIANNLRDYPTTVVDCTSFAPENQRRSGAIPLYTTNDIRSGEVFVTFEGMPVIEYNASMPIIPIFPGDDIGLHSSQRMRQIAWNTVQLTPYYLWDDLIMLSMAWVRLGTDILDVYEKHTKSLRLPNGCMTYPPPAWRQNALLNYFGWPIVVNESIVQSYTGQIRVAPVKLKNTVRFARLRTVGAFLVSGEIKPGGEVSYIAITSTAQSSCHLVRPWVGKLRIRLSGSMKNIEFTEKEGVLSFPTLAGSTYIVDRPDNPWEKQPITRITAHPQI